MHSFPVSAASAAQATDANTVWGHVLCELLQHVSCHWVSAPITAGAFALVRQEAPDAQVIGIVSDYRLRSDLEFLHQFIEKEQAAV